MLTRRNLLAGAALAPGLFGAPPVRFAHRGYLGWITDLASAPDSRAEWPSMRIDQGLLADYDKTFRLMSRLGYNEITIWGLYVSQSWPVDIQSSVSPERGRWVERILDSAHQQGIRVYSGLGVYSWGFEEIIRQHPKLASGNKRAMCPDVSESWEWMRKVTDFVLTRFPIDGVSMQSADQGRCQCAECKTLTDAEYHGRLNIKVADYIRSKYAGKTVAVNGWGMNFADPKSPESIVKISEHADYIVDVSDSVGSKVPGQRTAVLKNVKCAWGTIGGPQVEPPQHWQRERWFLPTVRRQSEHLQTLFQDGGRACEYFFHILANPGCELSFWMAGKIMANPATAWRTHLRSSLEEIYETTRAPFLEQVESLMLDTEDAYFSRIAPIRSATISMEPLVSSQPGAPVYLKRIAPEQRVAFAKRMEEISGRAASLARQAGLPRAASSRLQFIERATRNVIADVASLG